MSDSLLMSACAHWGALCLHALLRTCRTGYESWEHTTSLWATTQMYGRLALKENQARYVLQERHRHACCFCHLLREWCDAQVVVRMMWRGLSSEQVWIDHLKEVRPGFNWCPGGWQQHVTPHDPHAAVHEFAVTAAAVQRECADRSWIKVCFLVSTTETSQHLRISL